VDDCNDNDRNMESTIRMVQRINHNSVEVDHNSVEEGLWMMDGCLNGHLSALDDGT
jgi:hypothetical protein